MILIEKTQIMGLEPTIRGMRNPMNSWEKSDSMFAHLGDDEGYDLNGKIVPFASATHECGTDIGPNDLDLMLRLARAGSVDGKFRRMIAVYVDITAPLYWWGLYGRRDADLPRLQHQRGHHPAPAVGRFPALLKNLS